MRSNLAPTREALASIRDDGSHVHLHPGDTRGRYTFWRRLTAVVLIAVYVLLPWIPVGGAPAVFLDLANLRFHLFGLTLAAQDLWLAFFLITGAGFGLFYVTALFGRLWCGWACPQTVFLEHLYRRIERWLEGDAPARRQLDRAPWNRAKLLRRGAKHLLFILVSLLIAHVLLSYFVSLPRMFAMMARSPFEHGGIFLFVVVITGLLYGNFAWFREQLCVILCPYGRLQSALIDDHSVVIGYDARRGEPRGKRQRSEGREQASEDRGGRADGDQDLGAGSRRESLPTSDFRPLASGSGDCIDCFRCVQVCPTGIDIRQGLQLECVGCANCIDACDEVMDRIGRPRGLVRYDSLNGLQGLKTRFLRPRIVLYTLLLAVGATAAGFAVSGYQPATLNTVRMTGAPYYVAGDAVRNQFLVRLINKQSGPAAFTVTLAGGEGAPADLRWAGWDEAIVLAPDEEIVRPLIVSVPRDDYDGRFTFTVRAATGDGTVSLDNVVQFVGPDPRLFKARHRDAP